VRKFRRIPLPLNDETLARFWARVDKNGPTCAFHPELGPCWIWTGILQKSGYGRFYLPIERLYSWRRGRTAPFQAHRISHVLENGDFPDGMETDHKCENRSCVRPSHLEPVTSRINNLRGRGMGAANHRKTYCKRGHLLSSPGHHKIRRCQKCREEWLAAHPRKPDPRKYPLVCAYCGELFNGTSAQKRRATRGIQQCCSGSHAGKLRFAEGRNPAVQATAAANARKTNCPHGHPLTGSNLRILPRGGRRCRTCDLASLARLVSRRPVKIPGTNWGWFVRDFLASSRL
jgi:hypothetical protein